MMFGSLIITGQSWYGPAAAILAISIALLAWSYFRAPTYKWLRTLCAAFKIVGVLALLTCLLEPMWSGQRAKPGANLFAVVADNSEGLTIKDSGAANSRGEELRALLTGPDAAWPAGLEQNFQVRNFFFDARLQATRDFSELSFDGHASAIGGALRSVGQRFNGQPLAGILMLTDGIATDVSWDSFDFSGLPPVYPVLIGKDATAADLAVLKASVSQTVFEDAPVTVQAEVVASGYTGQQIRATLDYIDFPSTNAAATNVPAGAKPDPWRNVEQTLRAARDGDKLTFRFQFRPDKTGVLFYRLRVGAKDEFEQFAKPETSREATLANNERVITVDRGQGPYRILYVSGRPNWEYKFLQRAVLGDDQVQLVGLIRIAKREPKFEFRGRQGESSNPLFRGFGNQSKEEVERYDQPVLVRLNTRDEYELRGGFPKTPEEMFQYQAVVIDDLEAEFFSTEQMSLLQKFVSERGGGVLMLGGLESLGEGGFRKTPIGDMLPIYMDAHPEALADLPLRLDLSREGWLQPWVRLRDTEAAEKKRLSDAPRYSVLNRVKDIKPGATILATATDGKQTYPALIAQRFGRGRTAVLALGDFWHSGLGDEQRSQDLSKAWRQMVRFLVAEVPNRIELSAEPAPGETAQAMKLQVRARDEKFLPLDNATTKLSVRVVNIESGKAQLVPLAAAAKPVGINAEPSVSEAGVYEAVFTPKESGGYRAEAVVSNEAGTEMGRAATGWTTEFSASEFASVTPNLALMETIARKTGGEVVTPGGLDKFVRELANKRAPITENWTRPLWHTPTVFLFALACFIAEWGLRRWKGLA